MICNVAEVSQFGTPSSAPAQTAENPKSTSQVSEERRQLTIRHVDLSDLVVIPSNRQRFRERDLRVQRPDVGERAQEGQVEAIVGDVRDVSPREGHVGTVYQVLCDRRSDGADEVEGSLVGLRMGLATRS